MPIHFAVHIGRLLFAICTVVEINSSVLLIFSECKSSTWYCTVMVIKFHSRGRRKYEMHGVPTRHCKSVASSKCSHKNLAETVHSMLEKIK